MLLKNRLFTRVESEKNAQKIYIFCEGKDREYNYFRYFVGMDSRLNLIVHELSGNENNSPNGLYQLAIDSLLISEENPDPMYDYRTHDQVWIVVDTDKDKMDSRRQQLLDTRKNCAARTWNVAESNPCFEVWLYFHLENKKPVFEDIDISSKWKKFVGSVFKGGFDPRKHPILIQTAITNSEACFTMNQDNAPDISTTEVFKLAKKILAVGNIQASIERALQKLQ